MRTTLSMLLIATLTACWNPRYFAPREHVAATAPGGEAAASYAVPAPRPDAPAAGELRLWSQGAKARFTDDDREVVELHVGFELENNGDDLLALDLRSIVCEGLVVDGVAQAALLPVAITGDGTAPPGTTARVDVTFEPPVTRPRDVDGFAVRFLVRAADVVLLQQVTPFGVAVRRYVDDDPRWGGFGWGVGFGLGWHPHFWH